MKNGLAARRLHLGLTQAGLAARIGVSRDTISNIERGLHSPGVSLGLAIAQVVDTPLAEIFFDTPPPFGIRERNGSPGNPQLATRIPGKVAQRRKVVGLSQGQLAEAVGLTRETVDNIEGGVFETSTANALAIAAVLRTTAEELFDASPPHDPRYRRGQATGPGTRPRPQPKPSAPSGAPEAQPA